MIILENKNTFQPNPNLKQSIYISRLDRRLMPSLADFFAEGIKQGDLCIAIVTPRHRRVLNRRLRARGINVGKATRSDQYFTVNAKEIRRLVTDNEGDFDEVTYQEGIEHIADLAAQKGQRVRAFGEEVTGLRWPRLGGFYVPQNE